MRSAATIVVLLLTALPACRRRPATVPPPSGDVDLVPRPLALPDTLAGFAGGPIVHGPTWVRRRYARGATLAGHA
jgi:hypothetical protein